MTLRANDNMRAVVEKLIAKGRITLATYEHATASGMSSADIVKLAERNRRLKAQLEVHGNPARYRQPEPLGNANDPTPERLQKAGKSIKSQTIGRGAMVPLKSFRVLNVVDQYGNKFGLDHRTALARFMEDADYAERMRVANLNGSGRGSPGDRLGGLGGVPQHIRDANARYDWVWRNLAPDLRRTARALVLGTLAKPDGTAFSMEDFGADIFPTVIDRNRRWGAAAGALWALAGTLAALYANCPVRIRKIDESDRALDSIED